MGILIITTKFYHIILAFNILIPLICSVTISSILYGRSNQTINGQKEEYMHYATSQALNGIENILKNCELTASALLEAMGDQNSLDGITKDELIERIEQEMPFVREDNNSFKQYIWVLDRTWLGVFVTMVDNPNLDEKLRKWAKGGIVDYAKSEIGFFSPFGASAQDKGYKNQIGWRLTSATLMPLVVGYGVTKNQEYLDRIGYQGIIDNKD